MQFMIMTLDKQTMDQTMEFPVIISGYRINVLTHNSIYLINI